MTQTIILIHVGPVQDFIKSARRCRELWYGSRLLSQVSRAVASAIQEQTSADALIFPGRLDGDVSVANKIQAIIPGATPSSIEALTARARSRMMSFLQEEAAREFDRIRDELERLGLPQEDFLRDRAQEHIDSMMELFWVAVAFEPGDYAKARQRAESLLAARKNTRDWEAAPPVPAGIPKSSIDGVRESVLHERVYDARQRSPSYRDWMLPRVFGVHGEERLCGVGLLKRRGLPPGEEDAEVPPFHSTSHMASGPMRCRLATWPQATRPWQQLEQTLREELGPELRKARARIPQDQPTYEAHDPRARPEQARVVQAPHALPDRLSQAWGYDGIVLYPNRVDTSGPGALLAGLELDASSRDRSARRIQAAQRALLQSIMCPEPFAYYALLLADGDRMGKAIDAMCSPEKHKEFSHRLDREFAARCAQLVQGHGGSLIYSGGDDVLAILPLHTALACAVQLNATFDEVMSGLFEKPSARPTLSAGLAVAHYLEPFGEVRQQAKEAEQLAKDAGRARLAVSVRKRGNATLSVVGPWREAAGMALHERLPLWGRILSDRGVPRALAYKLEEAISPLLVEPGPSPHEDPAAIESMCRALVRGVLMRRDLQEERLEHDLLQLFEAALREQQALPARDGLPAPLRAVQAMAHELRIASTFNEAWQLAFGEPADDEAMDDDMLADGQGE